MPETMFRRGTPAAVRAVLAACALMTGAACATTGGAPQPFPRPDAPAARTTPPPADVPVATTGAAPDMYSVVGTALALRGTPYRNGGADPNGFDCSGFVWYVYAQHGVRVARTVTEQFGSTAEVPPDAIAPGDLLFFDTSGGVSHVGLAIGGNEFVHAPSSRGEVRVERLSAPYWSQRFLGAHRVR
jgi:cell wall-associated NlpC family hydrolase